MRICLTIFLCLLLVGCGSGENSYTQMAMMDAISAMETSSNYVLVDVRTFEEYNSGHIPDAICIPSEAIETEVEALPDKEQIIYVYCRSGNRSKQVASKLVSLGYTNIIEIGGIIDYVGEIE